MPMVTCEELGTTSNCLFRRTGIFERRLFGPLRMRGRRGLVPAVAQDLDRNRLQLLNTLQLSSFALRVAERKVL